MRKLNRSLGMTTCKSPPSRVNTHPYLQVRTKADFPFGVWDAFFWQEQKKAPQDGRNRPRLPTHVRRRGTHFSPGGERDVEDAVPYGVLVCKPPRRPATARGCPSTSGDVAPAPYNRVKQAP